MATFRRSITPGATYFFTVVTYRRRAVLTDPPCYRALREAFRRTKLNHPFDVEALVLLPDHLHCIWTLPPSDADYAMRWSLIKRFTSQSLRQALDPRVSASRRARGELGLWQRRFWEHQIRDDRDLVRHTDYIHWNPVKHGYVKQAKDWPHSTFHRLVRQGIYDVDWGGGSGEKESLMASRLDIL